MNTKDVLRIGAGLLLMVCLFPPWVQVVHRGQIQGSEPLGYAWVFRPPKPKIKTEPPKKGDPSYIANLEPEKPKSFNPNFNPDALSRLPDDPWQRVPETTSGPKEPNDDSYAMDGIAVRADLMRLAFEAVALLALLGLGMTFTSKHTT